MRQCTVPATAAYRNAYFIAGSHVFARTEPELSERNLGAHMLAHHSLHPVITERVFGQHKARPAGIHLFARLKKAEYGPVDFTPATVEQDQSSQQAGSMHIMPAGMHHPFVTRSERQSGLLADRERIHIGPQYHAPRQISPSFDLSQDTRSGNRTK